MARPKTEVRASVCKQIVAGYKKGIGLVPLSNTFEFSTAIIRRVLVEAGVALRRRGRPRKAS